MDRKPEKSIQVFHGCCRKNEDGTNRIIEKGKRCLAPTSYPFWKQIADIPASKICTRSQERKQKTARRGQYNRYLRKNGCENIKRWLEADDSEVYVMKESDTFFVVSPEKDSSVNVKEIKKILHYF